jgi:hypothetical protein
MPPTCVSQPFSAEGVNRLVNGGRGPLVEEGLRALICMLPYGSEQRHHS